MSKSKKERPTRVLREKILLLCSGDTEELYFSNFKRRYNKLDIEIQQPSASPHLMLEYAKMKSNNGNYLGIYCIFDKDTFTDFNDVIREINSLDGIHAIYSNQAFDLWFILHFRYVDGALSRKLYTREINTCLKRNDKNRIEKPYRGIYSLILQNQSMAIDNARKGYQRHMLDGGKNPSAWESCTNVYELVEFLNRVNSK